MQSEHWQIFKSATSEGKLFKLVLTNQSKFYPRCSLIKQINATISEQGARDNLLTKVTRSSVQIIFYIPLYYVKGEQ